ncbi:MAG TPA: PrsW family intramembrane metalloprotease [Thermoplasmatales archaeon]|nr:PrsW family intramembrane metalloprotease [Thermoplasmatales archaeon]
MISVDNKILIKKQQKVNKTIIFAKDMLWMLLMFAFIPPLIYLIWIRNTEKYEREPWIPLLFTFLWGATIAVIAAFILETLLAIQLMDFIENGDTLTITLGIIVAPIVEEFTKPLALTTNLVKKNINELEDGLVYGAVAGLGFSAMENLLYGIKFYNEGIWVLLALFYTRTIGCCLLHASATALTGYGYSKKLLQGGSIMNVIHFFIIATAAHSLYNIFAFSSALTGQIIGVTAAVAFALISITWVRKKIKTFDLAEKELKND